MTTRLDVRKAWDLWKSHRDGCPAMQSGDPCDCEDEDTWEAFEVTLDCYLLEREAPAAPKAPERGACDDCDGTGWLTFSDGTRAKCMACSGRGVTGGER